MIFVTVKSRRSGIIDQFEIGRMCDIHSPSTTGQRQTAMQIRAVLDHRGITTDHIEQSSLDHDPMVHVYHCCVIVCDSVPIRTKAKH